MAIVRNYNHVEPLRRYSAYSPAYASTLSEEDKNLVLRLHNEFRQKVANGLQQGQPGASNMLELVWDEELAIKAQRWADQHIYGHDSNRKTSIKNRRYESLGGKIRDCFYEKKNTPENYDGFGQNLFLSSSNCERKDFNIEEAVNGWFMEVVDPGFDSRFIAPFKIFPGAGHYTQMVWAETEAIGCGFSTWKSNSSYRPFMRYIVCNYGPGGNIHGDSMYKVGKAYSECANGYSKKYPGLRTAT